MPSVCLFATLDTKGAEAGFARQLLTSYGVDPDFADAAAHRLIDMLSAARHRRETEIPDFKNGATESTERTENT